jgi:hypothetical protein
VGFQPPIPVESERASGGPWLAGHLTAPLRDRGALAAAAGHLEQWLRSLGVAGDPRLPRELLARLRAGHTPLVQHILALNEVTKVGIPACLRIVGYDLDDLPLLQAILHRDRTTLLPTATYDRDRRVMWPAGFHEHADLARGEFMPELVSRFGAPAIAQVDDDSVSRFVYLRVGRFDVDLVPSVVPGSIVQVDTGDCGPRFISRAPRRDRPVFAVAHVRGLTCAYVDWLDDRRIALISTHHRRSPTIYRLDDEAVVLGRVTAELRPQTTFGSAVSGRRHDHCASRLIRPDPDRQTFGAFLRSSREAIGMTHRDAHAISRRVAEAYGDRRFAIGIGTLSDWESQRDLPLSVPHMISLAACYSVPFTDLLRTAGLRSSASFGLSHRAAPPLDLPEVALFQPALLPAVRVAADLPDLSWDDVFRCGDGATVFDRALLGGRYLIVNRRVRSVARASSSASIEPSLYIVSDECGRQICAGCFLDRDHLYIQPDPQLPLAIRAVSRDRIRIRGRVAAILRCR